MGTPQIKICGLTNVDQALACADLGADAIGLVFFEKSPRNLTMDQAREICEALPESVVTTGVFVNESFESIMQKVTHCGIRAVQLHGNESPELVARLRGENLPVVKVLYMESDPHICEAVNFNPSAFLVECAKGILPGGNALSWNFERVSALETEKPMLIAGGLSPDNIADAVEKARPDGVDVSSGVEKSPGQKDLKKVEAFITAVKQAAVREPLRRIF